MDVSPIIATGILVGSLFDFTGRQSGMIGESVSVFLFP